MRHPVRSAIILAFLPFLLVSCWRKPESEISSEEQRSSSSRTLSSLPLSAAETHNVSYIGTVRPKGISIYMEGTHRLEIDSTRFILLSSDTVDLNGYVGEKAEVSGALRPTVEEGGMIMRVEKIRLIEESSVASSGVIPPPSSLSSSFAPSLSSLSSSTAPTVPPSPSSPPSPPPTPSSASAQSRAPSSPIASQPTEEPTPSETLTQRTAAMAKQNLSAANWTQAYCTTHIGFCFPIHRNWWFMSFGAAAQALWHVEVSSEEITAMGDGPLTVNLLAGSLSAKGIADESIVPSGEWVIGYKEWMNDRHFEVRAPIALQEAVTYVTQHLTQAEVTP